MDSWAATLACLLTLASKTSESRSFGMLRSMGGELVVAMEKVGTSMDKSRLCNWVDCRAGILFASTLALVSSSSSPKASPSGSYMWRSRSPLTWQRSRDVKRYERLGCVRTVRASEALTLRLRISTALVLAAIELVLDVVENLLVVPFHVNTACTGVEVEERRRLERLP